MTTCKLSELIGPAFIPVHQAIKDGSCHRFVLAGGRGSLKSSFVSIEMLLLLISHPEIHGVVLRKVARTLRKSVFPQYNWAVEMLGPPGQIPRHRGAHGAMLSPHRAENIILRGR